MDIRIEEVREVKDFVINFLKGMNYMLTDEVTDFTRFHNLIVDNEINVDKIAENMYFINRFEWANPEIYKQLIIEAIPSLEYALKRIYSDDDVFYEYIEVENGYEKFYRDDMFYVYPIKTRRVYEIIEDFKKLELKNKEGN